MKQLNPTTRDAYLRVFTEEFIRAHIAGGTDRSQIKMRMKNDPAVQGSTLLSTEAALRLKRDFETMERNESMPNIVAIRGNTRYWYNDPVKVVNFDERGSEETRWVEFEFHVRVDDGVRKIYHFHAQKSARRAKQRD
jgi:hypothetical protein